MNGYSFPFVLICLAATGVCVFNALTSVDAFFIYRRINMENTFKKITFYELSKSFIDSYEKIIKTKFVELCNENKTLSKQFREHIKNLENISVEFHYDYLCEVVFLLDYIDFTYQYDYSKEYYTKEYVTGDVTIENGRAHLSNAEIKRDSSYSWYTQHSSARYYSSENTPILLRYGDGNYDDVDKISDSFENVTNDANIDEAILTKFTKYAQYADLLKFIKIKDLSKKVKTDIKDTIVNNIPNYVYFSFKINKITDLSVSNSAITIFPTAPHFDICVNFNGENYKLENLLKIEEIKSIGPTSEHFKVFEQSIKDTMSCYSKQPVVTKVFSSISLSLSLIFLIGCITIWVFKQRLGFLNYGSTQNAHLICMFIIMGFFSFANIGLLGPVDLKSNTLFDLYDETKTNEELLDILHDKCKENYKCEIRFIKNYLIFIFILNILFYVSGIMLLIKAL